MADVLSTIMLLAAALFICIGGIGAAKNHWWLNTGGFVLGLLILIAWIVMGG